MQCSIMGQFAARVGRAQVNARAQRDDSRSRLTRRACGVICAVTCFFPLRVGIGRCDDAL